MPEALQLPPNKTRKTAIAVIELTPKQRGRRIRTLALRFTNQNRTDDLQGKRRWWRLLFKQFYLNCLAHASYLIGDETTGTSAVVDPQRDIAQHPAFASENKLQINYVFLSHLHANF